MSSGSEYLLSTIQTTFGITFPMENFYTYFFGGKLMYVLPNELRYCMSTDSGSNCVLRYSTNTYKYMKVGHNHDGIILRALPALRNGK